MQTRSFPAFGSSDAEVNSALNVVIAYEDLETGKRAMKTYEYLVEQLGSQCIFANQMWKFDVLAVPKLKEIAAKDAAAAEIIIISAHEGRELPKEVKAWMELWLNYKSQTTALVGLFGGESVETPLRSYLEEIARRAKIAFFCQPGIWPGSVGRPQATPPDCKRSEKTFPFLTKALREERAVSHWGINE
ncbi:MAG TPA: hypothetical protein VG938_15280 [Verrucomicrobiae bacterium]|nr:hypothetical protein [Verrucomicrobiae bacterium]